MEISRNYTSPSFGQIRGNAKDIIKRLHSAAVELVLEQKQNNVADIIITNDTVKVAAREGYSLPFGLGEKGIKEFSPHHVENIYGSNYIAHSADCSVEIGRITNFFNDKEFEACRKIADKAYLNVKGEYLTYPECGTLSPEKYEKIVGTLVDLEL